MWRWWHHRRYGPSCWTCFAANLTHGVWKCTTAVRLAHRLKNNDFPERERGEGRGRSVGISENLAENYWTAAKQYVSVSDMSGRILPRLILFELVRSFGLISSSSLLSKCTLRKLKVFLYTVWKQRRVWEETHLVNKWMKYVFAYDVWLTLKHLRLTLNSELVLKLVLVPTFFVSFL